MPTAGGGTGTTTGTGDVALQNFTKPDGSAGTYNGYYEIKFQIDTDLSAYTNSNITHKLTIKASAATVLVNTYDNSSFNVTTSWAEYTIPYNGSVLTLRTVDQTTTVCIDKAYINAVATTPNYPASTITATGGTGAAGITLNWTTSSSPGYHLYRHDQNTQTWTQIYSGSALTYFDTAVSKNITYFYYVVPIDSSGTEYTPSNVASAKITPAGVFSMGTSRATSYQTLKIGLESTPGTLVPATKTLTNIELTQVPNIPVKSVDYAGSKGATGTQKGQRYTEARFSGVLDFNLHVYLATLAYGAVTPTVDNNTNKMALWRWNPSATDPLSVASATIEQGSVKGGEKFGYATMSDSSVKWSKEDAMVEGSFFGTAQTRNATVTPNIRLVAAAAATGATTLTVTTPGVSSGTILNGTYVTNLGKVYTVTGGGTITGGSATLTVSALAAAITAGEIAYTVPELASMPVDPSSIAVFVSLDGSTYTQLNDVLEGQVDLNGLWKPSFHVTDANNSFDRIVETNPNFGASVTLEEGTEASSFMSYLDNGTKCWLGVRATGAQINSAPVTNHLWRLNIPMYVTKPDPGDKSDVFGNTFTFDYAHDLNFGMFDLQIQNKLLSL